MSITIPRELRDAALSLGNHLRSAGMSDPYVVPQQDHLVVVGADDWKSRIPTRWESWEVWHRVA